MEGRSSENGAAGSAVLFGQRRREVAEVLERALDELDVRPRLRPGQRFVVTGVGASEGPARAFASLLGAELGVPASFVPLSSFYASAPTHLGDTLVIFSQGLSPNARMALRRAASFREAWLFTSLGPGCGAADEVEATLAAFVATEGRVVTLPPASEGGMLARLIGPAVATLAGCFFVEAARRDPSDDVRDIRARLARAVDAVRTAEARVSRVLTGCLADPWARPVCFVAAGDHLERCRGFPHRWLEALPGLEPPLWDVLQVAHGPFQAFWEQPVTIVTLERAESRERDLFDRLSTMLSPRRHALVRLGSSLPAAWASLDHDAQINELIWRCLSVTPRDTSGWPGSGLDAPLYGLDAPDDPGRGSSS